MASSATRKWSKSSRYNTHESDHDEGINSNLYLTEERRLLRSKPETMKNSTTNPVSQKSLQRHYEIINRFLPEQLDEELERRQLSTSGDIDIRRERLKRFRRSELMHGPNKPLAVEEQPFEYIAVVDFEATCEKQHNPNFQNEIIEFPIVLIDVKQRAIIDRFQSYCRPIRNPILSKFCTELTGIEQRQVNRAPPFVDVLHNVEAWLKERNLLSSSSDQKLAFATDGPWDFANFLQVQCRLSSIPFPQWAERWINIRKEFSIFYSVRRGGIDKMLNKLGLNFDGRPHSGLDDSINIARIAIELLKDGCILSLNDGLRIPDTRYTRMNNAETKCKESWIK